MCNLFYFRCYHVSSQFARLVYATCTLDVWVLSVQLFTPWLCTTIVPLPITFILYIYNSTLSKRRVRSLRTWLVQSCTLKVHLRYIYNFDSHPLIKKFLPSLQAMSFIKLNRTNKYWWKTGEKKSFEDRRCNRFCKFQHSTISTSKIMQ